MQLEGFNEFASLQSVAVRAPKDAFINSKKIDAEWQQLRFHKKPSLVRAHEEYATFLAYLRAAGAEVVELAVADGLTLDAIYTRDALLVSPEGLILCNMGRQTRSSEPACNAEALETAGYKILGEIKGAGTLEGGDVIWLHERALAVGLGPRTNAEGIAQLKAILPPETDVHIVPLPSPDHPDDVFHLMSMISPLDQDLALIYRPLMPESFLRWLAEKGLTFVEVPETEFFSMGCNVLALGPRKLLMLEGLPETKARLEAAGCSVTTYAGDEISRKGEGGPTCLTRPLRRGHS